MMLTIFMLQLGYIPYIPVAIIDMVANTDAAEIMHYVFSFLIPPYNIFGGLYYIDRVSNINIYLLQYHIVQL